LKKEREKNKMKEECNEAKRIEHEKAVRYEALIKAF